MGKVELEQNKVFTSSANGSLCLMHSKFKLNCVLWFLILVSQLFFIRDNQKMEP